MTLIDAHCHLQLEAFDHCDPFEGCEATSSDDLCVSAFVIADYSSERRSRLLDLNVRPNTYISAGLHPWALSEGESGEQANQQEWERLVEFVEKNRSDLVAIGECGVDVKMRRGATLETQRYWFERQMELAQHVNLPVIFHIVGGEELLIAMLEGESFSGVRGLCHSFSGTPEQAKKLTDLGCLISVGTDIVKGRGRVMEVCRQLGPDFLAIETDSPSRCPKGWEEPMRPKYLKEIAKRLASITNVNIETVAEKTATQTSQFFGIC